jgi:hypothetical protein
MSMSRTRRASWLSGAFWSVILLLASIGPVWMVVRSTDPEANKQRTPTRYAPFAYRPGLAALPIPSQPLPLDGAYRRGRTDAPVVVVEYSNFESPDCRQFHRTMLPALLKEYVDRGTAQWVFRHFPVAPVDSHANAIMTAAECAGSQGAFWRYHDRLFGSAFATARYSELAAELGLNRARFDACVTVGAAGRIDADQKQAAGLGLPFAPSWVIGVLRRDGNSVSVVRIYTSVKPLEGYRRGIEESLARAQGNRWAPERHEPSSSPRARF